MYTITQAYEVIDSYEYNYAHTRAPAEIFPEWGQPPFLAGQGGGQLEFFVGFNGQNERISRARVGPWPPLPMPGAALVYL